MVSGQKLYPPELNLMIKEIIFEKIKDVVIPDVMKKYHEVDFPDFEHGNHLYSVKFFDMELDAFPLNRNQMRVEFHEDKNAMFVEVINLFFTFQAKMKAKLLHFVHAHGSATIDVDIERFKFMVNPILVQEGDINQLSYHIDELDIIVLGAYISHLSVNHLPTWLFRGACNRALELAILTYDAFRGPIEAHVIKVLNEKRMLVPPSINIKNHPLNVSLSFPNNIVLKSDRIEVPFDGTIFYNKTTYHPDVHAAPAMPSYNPQNPNNFQLFLNQHMLKTAFDAARAAKYKYVITKDTLKPLGFDQNFMTSEYFSMIFPYMSCKYDDPNSEIIINVLLDDEMTTEIDFAPNKVIGYFSPSFEIYVNNDLALTLAITTQIDMSVNFTMKERYSIMTANIDDMDITAFKFTPGTVSDTDIQLFFNYFKAKLIQTVKTNANSILNKGCVLPTTEGIQWLFKVAVERIDIEMKDKHVELSFNVDIWQKEAILQKLLELATQ